MGVFLAIWRRFFGGYGDDINLFSSRGLQCILLITVITLWRYYISSDSIYLAITIAIYTYWYFSKKHYPYFLCGTEPVELVQHQIDNGRKPMFLKTVNWISNKLKLDKYGKQWCFIGLFMRYVVLGIPFMFLISPYTIFTVLLIPFIYNACYWIQFPPYKNFLQSPTNYAEFITGLMIGWMLM